MSHSQEKDLNKNSVKVAMTTNKDGEKVLLSCLVNKSWKEVNEEIGECDLLKSDAVLIADAEPGLINNLKTNKRRYQLDFLHFVRDIGYNLWKDDKLSKNERKDILKKVEEVIYKLKNQANKYADNKDLLKEKVNEAVDKLKKISDDLIELDCVNAANLC